jgi:HEAT repeat protein
MRIVTIKMTLLAVVVLAGCNPSARRVEPTSLLPYRHRALDCLKRAAEYKPNPVVRAAAVEAFEASGCPDGLPWIRAALRDDHPAVRFAACLAAGALHDALAEEGIRECLDDEDPSVRVAALGAMHHLGRTEHTGRIPEYLLGNEDPAVRANAAIVLGRMQEPGAIKILARAMLDKNIGVQNQAAEALARLGNPEARQHLAFMANSGIGSEEVFALSALTQTGDPKYLDLYRSKFEDETIPHLEVRLTAARALATLKVNDGYRLALASLNFNKPKLHDAEDTAAGQVLRVRQLAAAALGAMRDRSALGELLKVLEDNQDARIQVSAAKAILEIIATRENGEYRTHGSE